MLLEMANTTVTCSDLEITQRQWPPPTLALVINLKIAFQVYVGHWLSFYQCVADPILALLDHWAFRVLNNYCLVLLPLRL